MTASFVLGAFAELRI